MIELILGECQQDPDPVLKNYDLLDPDSAKTRPDPQPWFFYFFCKLHSRIFNRMLFLVFFWEPHTLTFSGNVFSRFLLGTTHQTFSGNVFPFFQISFGNHACQIISNFSFLSFLLEEKIQIWHMEILKRKFILVNYLILSRNSTKLKLVLEINHCIFFWELLQLAYFFCSVSNKLIQVVGTIFTRPTTTLLCRQQT